MMTREEAIVQIKGLKNYCEDMADSDESGSYVFDLDVQALDIALSSLRPVSREQVEKVYPACDVCGGGKEIRSDNFCGMARLRIVGDSINLRGDEKKIKFFGHIYAPSFSVRFCPFCGKTLTDEAVEMVMERLEALQSEIR